MIVEDSGPGVPPELREQIFNPFFTSKKDGVGLGLSIVAKIVDDHRGTIRLEEQRPARRALPRVFPAGRRFIAPASSRDFSFSTVQKDAG